MYQSEKEYLLKLGLKEKLLDYLNSNQISSLAEYALEHHKHPDLIKVLISLASLERRGKLGAIELVALGIITPIQAKNLKPDQLLEILETYHTQENDEEFNMRNARTLAKQMIIDNQQERVYQETGEHVLGIHEEHTTLYHKREDY